jgi:hypothetical protein
VCNVAIWKFPLVFASKSFCTSGALRGIWHSARPGNDESSCLSVLYSNNVAAHYLLTCCIQGRCESRDRCQSHVLAAGNPDEYYHDGRWSLVCTRMYMDSSFMITSINNQLPRYNYTPRWYCTHLVRKAIPIG